MCVGYLPIVESYHNFNRPKSKVQSSMAQSSMVQILFASFKNSL